MKVLAVVAVTLVAGTLGVCLASPKDAPIVVGETNQASLSCVKDILFGCWRDSTAIPDTTDRKAPPLGWSYFWRGTLSFPTKVAGQQRTLIFMFTFPDSGIEDTIRLEKK